MMRHILIDTNVILDTFLRREPFWECAGNVFHEIESETCIGYVSATTITDIYYVLKKYVGSDEARKHLHNLVNSIGIEILAIDKETILHAFSLPMTDFEDAVQVAAASQNGIGAIVTQNTRDFRYASIDAMTPEQFLSKR
ncbi:MAG: type II toxin-antitoxin system VapC family toxin [Thermoguttaceae bacterium]